MDASTLVAPAIITVFAMVMWMAISKKSFFEILEDIKHFFQWLNEI